MKYKIVYNDELRHFGVKGMKWGEWNEETRARYIGIRKNSSRVSNTGKKRRSNNPKKMSDEELKKRTERLQREVNYRNLQKQANPGRTYVTNLLGQIGSKVIATAGAGAILYAIKVAAGGNFNPQELANAIFNGGAKKK